MFKRLTVTLVLAFFSLFLALSHFVAAQGGETGSAPALRKTSIDTLPAEPFVQRSLSGTTRIYPFNSYGSGDFFFPPYLSESDRMGYGKASAHDASPLYAGWYVDWDAVVNPQHPSGAEYARTIMFSVHDTGTICDRAPAPATMASQVTPNFTGTALIDNVRANPGALWLIGNEPDNSYNRSPIQAELYAELYHYFYTTIKAADPTAKVAIGGITQPSPVRIEYLDRILSYYQLKYDQPFPTDLWNIHFYYLNETECEWGASIPPFGSPDLAWRVSVQDLSQGRILDLPILETYLRNFRQWMYERGYQNTPLIITEYGVLPPPEYGSPYSNEQAALFLRDTFQLFRTITDTYALSGTLGMTGTISSTLRITDTATGYPADGYRLVQMWNWFSTWYGAFGGDLFEADGDLSIIGMAFGYETLSNSTPYIDLEIIAPFTPALITETFSLGVFLNNRGNTIATDVVFSSTVVNYFDQTVVSATVETIGDLLPRYRQEPFYVEKSWSITLPAVYTVAMELNAYQTDVVTTNNDAEQLLAVYPDLAVTGLDAPAVIDWRKSGSDTFSKVNVTISATITNVGNWTSTLTPMAMKLHRKGDPFSSATRSMTAPVLAPQGVFTVSTTWQITDIGSYIATVLVNSPYDPTRELDAHNNMATTSILVPDHWVHLPIINRNSRVSSFAPTHWIYLPLMVR